MFVRETTVAELGVVKTAVENAREQVATLHSNEQLEHIAIEELVEALATCAESLDRQMNPPADPPSPPAPVLDSSGG